MSTQIKDPLVFDDSVNRYELNIGKYGTYFWDRKYNRPMSNMEILRRLEELDPLKDRLARVNKRRKEGNEA